MTGPSGVLLLADEVAALRARLSLAANARSSIDVQYYIWSGDAVGIAVIKELLAAAQRGVHIRLLVDDIHFIGYDRRVLGLDAYDNVEIRSFNPFRYRFRDSPLRSVAEIISGAARLNHRMHNKVFAVDGEVAILGGRNLSNEYFGAHAEFNFRDMDILTTGVAVAEVCASFSEYWHSPWAVPLKDLHKRRIKPVVMHELVEGLSREERQILARIDALDCSDFMSECAADLAWCSVEVLADAPQKMDGRAGFESPVRQRLFELNSSAEQEVLIENGYFIPRDEGLARLHKQLQRDVKIKVLTNSLASNDTGLSHAGYRRYRQQLLEAGVELYETRIDAALGAEFELNDRLPTSVGLHSKAATIDRQIGFVGSYNLDPRSAFINTEIGLVVHDVSFAAKLATVIEQGMAAENAWRLGLQADGALYWQHEQLQTKEPKAHWRKRLLAGLLAYLPVERQL